jgi:galactose mutarotase-like enzyme
VERTDASITCGVDVRPNPTLGTFPFAFRAEYSVAVGDKRVDCRLRVTSTSDRHQPLSAGWHPYLYREEGCRLRIPSASVWTLDGSEEPVPTGELEAVGLENDFRNGREIAAHESWDLTFTDLAADEDGLARSWIKSAPVALQHSGKPVRLAVRRIVEAPTTELPNVQLYTAPGRRAIAVEPFSSPPNALALLEAGHPGTNVRRLAPGDTVALHMGLVLEVL